MTLQVIQAGLSTDSIQKKSTATSKTSFGDTLGMAAASFGGPAMMVASEKDTSTQAITAAAVNATYGGASLMTSSNRSYSPYSTGGLGYGSMGSYYSGGANLTTSSGTTATDVESMLSESAMSQAYLIGLQAQMGNQSVQTNAISNTLNMKNMMELSVIRNMKTS